jgi:putative peptidoglycan lipid II flippase
VSERLEAVPDTLLAGRYRLQRVVAPRECTTTWQGRDEVLARLVAVKILDAPDRLPNGTAGFLDAAVSAGRLTHPRVASVFDAAEEGGLTYVVEEWVEGTALADLLRDGPLSAPRATTIAAQVAETMAYAHSRGVYHRGLTAHDVIVCADGAVKVTDFEVAAASRPADRPGPDGDLPDDLRDIRAVGAILYACLTARSATGNERGLPAAPRSEHGLLLSPRQVRAGVPREVDAVVIRTLLPELLRKSTPITTAAELVAALAPLPGEGGGTTARTLAFDDDEPRARPWLRRGVPLAVVAGVGVAGALAGLAVGRVPGQVTKLPGLGNQVSAQPEGNAAPGTPIAPVSVKDFDPQGDGEEMHNEVGLAYNGDLSDAWHTTTYYNSAAFGNLKPGVGLLVDFGKPTSFDRVIVAFAQPGESIELRAADTVTRDIATVPLVASASDVKVPVTLRPAAGTNARYWVVWITRLVQTGDNKFSAGIAELGFFK